MKFNTIIFSRKLFWDSVIEEDSMEIEYLKIDSCIFRKVKEVYLNYIA
jgi:hypothetical protein